MGVLFILAVDSELTTCGWHMNFFMDLYIQIFNNHKIRIFKLETMGQKILAKINKATREPTFL